MNSTPPPEAAAEPTGKLIDAGDRFARKPAADLVELPQPRTCAEAFTFLATRGAELAVQLRAQAPEMGERTEEFHMAAAHWAQTSEVLKGLAEFSKPVDFAQPRHIRWAYEAVLRRIPESAGETQPMVMWLGKVPACATDKAAPSALLFHYLARACAIHSGSIPHPQRQKRQQIIDPAAADAAASWFYERNGIVVSISNEEAYQLSAQKHFWAEYSRRLVHLVGVLLREICGLKETKTATVPEPGVEARAAEQREAAEGQVKTEDSSAAVQQPNDSIESQDVPVVHSAEELVQQILDEGKTKPALPRDPLSLGELAQVDLAPK